VGVDALDDSSIEACPAQQYRVLVVPEYLLGSILGLAGCFMALGFFSLSRRKRGWNGARSLLLASTLSTRNKKEL